MGLDKKGSGFGLQMSKIPTEVFLLLVEEMLPIYVKSTKDIYERRSLLKQLLLEEYPINYLLDIIIKAVNQGTRFRTLDCLKVVRAVLRNNTFGTKLDAQTVDKLFYLYKTFIGHRNGEIRACANMLVWSQCLEDEHISWLISHWHSSEHSLNRLLRYPQRHPLITQWATEIYKQGHLQDRTSEIIALLIEEKVPEFVTEDDEVIVWAIYYSRATDAVKQKLLMERFSVDSLESLWEVALRLKRPQIIDSMRASLREQIKAKE